MNLKNGQSETCEHFDFWNVLHFACVGCYAHSCDRGAKICRSECIIAMFCVSCKTTAIFGVSRKKSRFLQIFTISFNFWNQCSEANLTNHLKLGQAFLNFTKRYKTWWNVIISGYRSLTGWRTRLKCKDVYLDAETGSLLFFFVIYCLRLRIWIIEHDPTLKQ